MIFNPILTNLSRTLFGTIPVAGTIVPIAGIAYSLLKLHKEKSEKVHLVLTAINDDVYNNLDKTLFSVKNQINTIFQFSNQNFNPQILCILPEASYGKEKQKQLLTFADRLSKNLSCKVHFIEKQFYYDDNPEITADEVIQNVCTDITNHIGDDCFFAISDVGKLQIYSELNLFLSSTFEK